MSVDPAAACRAIVRASGSSFAISFRFLPRRQRRAMEAVYAFCRRTDDIADADGDLADRRVALERWRAQLDAGGPDPVIRAMLDTAREFDLDLHHCHAVIDGCEMDLAKTRHATYEELDHYCSLVAGAVGHLCLGVWGLCGRRAEDLAEFLGRAVQLTNIIRDVREDAARDRIYIPQDLLRAVGPAGVSEDEVLSGRITVGVRRCLSDMAARAGHWYARSQAIIDDLPRPDRRRVWPAVIILDVYRRLLQEIVRQDFPEERVRLRLGKIQGLGLALRTFVKSRLG